VIGDKKLVTLLTAQFYISLLYLYINWCLLSFIQVPVFFPRIPDRAKDVFQDSILTTALKSANSFITAAAMGMQTTLRQKTSVTKRAHVSRM